MRSGSDKPRAETNPLLSDRQYADDYAEDAPAREYDEPVADLGPDVGDTASERRPDGGEPTRGMRFDGGADTATPLFPETEAEEYRRRWTGIQTDFVDEPRRSVEDADRLVNDVTERLTAIFARSRDELEGQWTAGSEVSTEDLRRTLQRYRSFFERLLSM